MRVSSSFTVDAADDDDRADVQPSTKTHWSGWGGSPADFRTSFQDYLRNWYAMVQVERNETKQDDKDDTRGVGVGPVGITQYFWDRGQVSIS